MKENLNKKSLQENSNFPILLVENLSVQIKDRFLVKNASFSLKKGECFGIVGEDKSGKTSLIKAISGSLPIGQSQVFIEGKDIYFNKKMLKKVSTSFDPPVFFKYQSVYENLKFLSALSEKTDKLKIKKTLAMFGLEQKLKTRVLHLTYQEKKLMSLALALLTEPEILFLDEPFKDLSSQNQNLIDACLDNLKHHGTTILMASRNLESIQKKCDEVIFMENKQIIKIFSKNELEQLNDFSHYAYIKVKYPHFAGKIISNQFNIKVKILDKRVIFEAGETLTSEIVKFVGNNKIPIYRAGYLNNKSEKIFAMLAPFCREE